MRINLIADAAPGSGHLVRAFALAERAIARGWSPTLITRAMLERTPAAWDAAPCPVLIVKDYRGLPHADAVIVDSYRDAGLFPSNPNTIAYDDIALLLAPTVKAVVNPNVGAERFKYPGHLAACGARYATIRSRFAQIQRERIVA